MPTTHTVEQGDCIESIAARHGLRPDTVWDDPGNEALREERARGALQPGDQLVIPDLRMRTQEVRTGATHRFRRRCVPATLRVRLRHEGEPRANVEYQLQIDEERRMGKSDADGWIDEWIAPSTREVLLIIDGRRYQVRLGHVDPASTERGVRSRLANLGYLDRDDPPASLLLALHAFRANADLPKLSAKASFEELADADLSQALVAKHGG